MSTDKTSSSDRLNNMNLPLVNTSLPRSVSTSDVTKASTSGNQDNPYYQKPPDINISSDSFESHTNHLETPQLQLNGSLLTISNSHLMSSASKFMDYTRKASLSSQCSDSRRNLLFQNVGRTLQRTHSQLRRTRLLHAFYLFALPIYTLMGALLFQVITI